jgi:hypothetical protein
MPVRTFALTATSMPMMPDAIEQAAPTMKAKPVMTRSGRPASFGTSATSAVSTRPMTTPMTTAPTTARIPMVVYWRRRKATRTLVDGAGDVLHRLGPGVARQDVPGEVEGEQDGDDPGRQDDQLKRTRIHRGRRSSTMGWVAVPIPARGVRHSGAGDVGVSARGPFGIRFGAGPCRPSRV